MRFADDRTMIVVGIGKLMIKRKNGKSVIIEDVLYMLEVKRNLLSIGQLIEK